ncbi:hypothetical protein G2W53_001583 [Senna tora]|uniref:RNase H type-1 domain-containing protein n=1 Tax=Senna tora TaxID=362788 RepID=A0A834XJZ6_9FABA|nr:hypothetical protein G2W53_001583 [Senna tora]
MVVWSVKQIDYVVSDGFQRTKSIKSLQNQILFSSCLNTITLDLVETPVKFLAPTHRSSAVLQCRSCEPTSSVMVLRNHPSSSFSVVFHSIKAGFGTISLPSEIQQGGGEVKPSMCNSNMLPSIRAEEFDTELELVIDEAEDAAIGSLNRETLSVFFPLNIANSVLSIPFSKDPLENSWFWSLTPNGFYTVKSRNRELRNILPVCLNLSSRGVDVEPCCPICKEDEEFWNEDNICLFAIATYKIWNRRNELRLGLNPPPIQILKESIFSFWSKVRDLQGASPQSVRVVDRCLSWTPPPAGCWKVNVDASKCSDLATGIGSVIQNFQGRVLGACASRAQPCASVKMLEASAILAGLEFALRFDCELILVEGDAKALFEKLNSQSPSISWLGTLLDSIRSVCAKFSSCSFSWVPRSANNVANNIYNGHMNVLIVANIRSIRTNVFPSPIPLSNIARIPNRSIQKHRLLRKPLFFPFLPHFPPHYLPIDLPLDRIPTPSDRILVKPIGAIEPQVVNPLPVPAPAGEEIRLHDGLVLPQELEVDLVLGFVALEGGEVDVEIEAAGVAFGALDEGSEGAVVESGGGAPPCAAAVVVGEGDGVGFRAVGTGVGGVVDGDLFEGLGVVVGVGFWVESRVGHWWGKKERIGERRE